MQVATTQNAPATASETNPPPARSRRTSVSEASGRFLRISARRGPDFLKANIRFVSPKRRKPNFAASIRPFVCVHDVLHQPVPYDVASFQFDLRDSFNASQLFRRI